VSAGPAFAQTTVDDFAATQAGLISPPVPASSTATGAGILGGERDLRVERTAGAGNAAVQVAGGALSFTVDAGTAGEVVAVWDGADGDALSLAPTGLGGVDLTAGGQNGLRLRVSAASGLTSVVIDVFTDAGRSSRAALVAPAVGSTTDFVFPFESFAPTLGAGADFASVGAISLFLRGASVAVVLEDLSTMGAAPAIVATASDGVTSARPGDTLPYTLTLGNTGTLSAQGSSLASTLDPNTTLVAGSLEVSPLARDDFYAGAIRGNPFVVAAPGILANDVDGDGDPLAARPNAPIPTTQGGSVSLAADGGFAYTPPADFRGVDVFAYQADDGQGIPGDGQVTLLVECPVVGVTPTTLSDAVTGEPYPPVTFLASGTQGTVTWSAAGTLPTGMNLSAAGLLDGTPTQAGSFSITVTASDAGGCRGSQALTLAVNQAPAFASADNATFTVGAAGSFTVTTTGFPVPTITRGGVALPAGLGFVDNADGTGTLSGTPEAGTAGSYAITFTAANGVLPDAVQAFTLGVECPAIAVTPTTLPDAVYNVAYGGGAGVQFVQTGGTGAIDWAASGLPAGLTLSVTGLLSGTPTATGSFTVTVTATDALSCSGTTGAMTLLARPRAIGDAYAAVGNTQLVVAGHSAPGTPFTASSTGLLANDEGPLGTLAVLPVTAAPTVLGGAITIDAAGAFTYTPPRGVAGADSFAYTVTSNGVAASATIAIAVSDVVWYVNGLAAAGNGQSQSPFNTLAAAQADSAAGHFIFVHSGATPTSYPTGIALKAGQTLWGQGTAFALSALAIPATSKPVLGGTVSLAANSTVSSVDMSSGAATGLSGSAIAGATVTNGVAVTSTTGTAVSLANVTASAITLRSVASNGAANGINLLNTTGSFEVTGDGASDPANTTRGRTTARSGGGTIVLGSGGTIQGSTGPGVLLVNAASVTLRNLTVQNNGSAAVNSGGDGIKVTSSTNLTLDNVLVSGQAGNNGLEATNLSGLTLVHTEISGNATAAGVEAPDVWNVRLDNLTGTASVSHSLFSNSRENVVGIVEAGASALNLVVTNSEFRDTAPAAPGNVGLLISAAGTANVTASVTGSSFLRNRSTGFQYAGNEASGGGAVTLDGNVFEGNSVDTNVQHQGQSKTVTFSVTNNLARQATSPAPTDSSVSLNTFLAVLGTPSTLLRGTISGNSVGTDAIADSGSFLGQGISLTATGPGTITATVSANTVRQVRQDDAFFALSSNHTGALNVGVLNNAFSVNTASGFGLFGIDLTAGALPSDTGTLCANVSGNTATGDPNLWGIQAQTASGNPTIDLQGYAGPPNDALAISTFFNANNTVSPPAQSFILAGTIKAAPASCPVP
jgi:uncharacterized repeat protein (TIGR01451 family)